MSDPTPTTTTLLLRSLDVMIHQATLMKDVVHDAAIADADRRGLARIFSECERINDWLGQSRLEEPRN